MISDLLILEHFYGAPACAQFFEDLSKRYGPKTVQNALSSGDIVPHAVHCGPDKGRILLWLSEKGRLKAQNRVTT